MRGTAGAAGRGRGRGGGAGAAAGRAHEGQQGAGATGAPPGRQVRHLALGHRAGLLARWARPRAWRRRGRSSWPRSRGTTRGWSDGCTTWPPSETPSTGASCRPARALGAAEGVAAARAQQLAALTRDNKGLERRVHHLAAKVSSLQSSLAEERSLAAALASKQAGWQEQAEKREQEFNTQVSELKEQLRDVMFFVEARGQLERTDGASAEEIAGASVSVAPAKPRRKRR
ncbi:hypothetical protein MSG28_005995 [Choristoneura fumiferana]|uniref:Uncharacterized protein n=1 Tax=Choristoneura fumiferana TaxID=7141 RepID=A0ACC0L2E6_CHOFU|nr:hypothetical protein MSG28_005995 [Choristoneura fumiferana]